MSDFGFSQLPNSRGELGDKPEKQSLGAILSLHFSLKTHTTAQPTTQHKTSNLCFFLTTKTSPSLQRL